MKNAGFANRKSSIFGAAVLTALLFALSLLVFPGRVYGANPVAKVFGLQVEKAGITSVKLSWVPVSGAEGYIVCVQETSGWKEVGKTHNSTYSIDAIDGSPLVSGRTYVFSVCAYRVTEKDLGSGSSDNDNSPKELVEEKGEMADAVSVTPGIAVPGAFTAEGISAKSIRLSWQASEDASGYILYRSTKKNRNYKVIKTIKKATTESFTDKKCKIGKVYYYKIVAYSNAAGGRVLSSESEIIESATLLKAPKLKKAVLIDGNTAQLTWKKVSGAKGYIIYRSTVKDGLYVKTEVVENGGVTSSYVRDHENGKTYYYKVCAYGNKKKKATYSAFSKIKSLTFNLYPSKNDDFTQKAMRIFGVNKYVKYATEEEAKSHQTTIRIAVWDFGSDGVTKVTKYRYLTVHEKIAPTVAQIFKEIYEGEEKFPIKNVGGYSWRGATSRSEHCEGLAIDINWEENYLIDNGVVISGKLYQPGVNPYSIPTDGEVVRIMNKYGFKQGIWGNRCDYMHFSFFGT
ncbi:MAG: M15 family metallopeptidase [Lachnospiraceae bacterium]|nr:M15 family metallopeptidase [Lachnospiraceae bacterium]